MDEVGDRLEIDATVAEIIRRWIAVDPRRLSDVTDQLLSEQCLPQSFLDEFALGDPEASEAKLDREDWSASCWMRCSTTTGSGEPDMTTHGSS